MSLKWTNHCMSDIHYANEFAIMSSNIVYIAMYVIFYLQNLLK